MEVPLKSNDNEVMQFLSSWLFTEKNKGPFKYYVIKRMGGLGRPNDYVIT